MTLDEIRYWRDYYRYKLTKTEYSSVNSWEWGYLACKERLEYFEQNELEFIKSNMNLRKVRRHSRTD